MTTYTDNVRTDTIRHALNDLRKIDWPDYMPGSAFVPLNDGTELHICNGAASDGGSLTGVIVASRFDHAGDLVARYEVTGG